MLEWLIIGGGIHGMLMANFLRHHKQISHDKMRVLDIYSEPLHRWKEFSKNCGMKYLRSTIVHHIDIDPFSLKKFSSKAKNPACFTAPYSRPSLGLFNDHCQYVIEKNSLDKFYIQAEAKHVRIHPQFLEVETSCGTLQAKHVLLATGTRHLNQPTWSQALNVSQVQHIFTPNFNRNSLQNKRSIVIVGSGITAAQTAMAVAKQYPSAKTTLLSKHQPQIHQFDSDPGWISGNLKEFHCLSDYQKRRQIIDNVRHRGSMTKDVAIELKSMIATKKINHVIGKIKSTSTSNESVELKTADTNINAEKILLATGFCKDLPGSKWLSPTIEKWQLPQAPCGYPIVSKNLHCAHNIFVTGPLAELEIGPVSRNIVGARLAAKRLIGIN